jgi:acyl-CoA synthetase (AMP-forming)/AMP-acid ligase II
MADGGVATTGFSPLPILDCIEGYRGTITEIESGAVWSGDAFARAREALMARFVHCGFASGDRVALAVSNGPHFIAAFAGILACGASPLLLHAKTPAAELHRYARKFGLQYLVREPETEDEAGAFGRILDTFAFAPQTSLRISRFE